MKNLKTKLAILATPFVASAAFAESTAEPLDVSGLLSVFQSIDIQSTVTTAGTVVLGVTLSIGVIYMVMNIIKGFRN